MLKLFPHLGKMSLEPLRFGSRKVWTLQLSLKPGNFLSEPMVMPSSVPYEIFLHGFGDGFGVDVEVNVAAGKKLPFVASNGFGRLACLEDGGLPVGAEYQAVVLGHQADAGFLPQLLSKAFVEEGQEFLLENILGRGMNLSYHL